MLPKLLSAGLLLATTLTSFAQDAKDILKKSFKKCQSIRNGYYELDNYKKYMSGKDTTKTSLIYYFKKLNNGPTPAPLFHTKHFYKDEYTGEVIYTGDDLVRAYSYDSTATIMSKTLWANDIKEAINSSTFCTPLTNWKNSPMPPETAFNDRSYVFKFIGKEVINHSVCYHIQVNKIPANNSSEEIKRLREEQHYWIKKEDFVPIQYTVAYDMVMSNDTMYQYEKVVLTRYEVNSLKDEHIFTLSSIPAYYKIKDYVPTTYPELLPKDTIAPNYTLPSITGEEISLADFKGKLVLVDFFYKSCYPCMQALPALQALHEKYKDKGLKVIGIDPFDKKEDLAPFLAKRGVNYSVLFAGENVAKDYRVSGYPTMYLIGKDGKIIYVQDGYSKDFEKALEETILQNL